MVNLNAKDEKQKNLTHIITSGVIGAALVPLLNKAIKPVVQRVVIPSLGPVAGTIVNAAVFVIIPPVAGMIGEVVAKKGPQALNNVSNFAKGISSKMKNNADARSNEKLSKIATQLRTEERSRAVKEFEKNLTPNSMADLVNQAIKDKSEIPSPDAQLDTILNRFKNDDSRKES